MEIIKQYSNIRSGNNCRYTDNEIYVVCILTTRQHGIRVKINIRNIECKISFNFNFIIYSCIHLFIHFD